jgi:hypothetical protein
MEYLYRIEEGLKRERPSAIGAVRKDGKDFDDVAIARLRSKLELSFFPKSTYRLFFESDEFRRFVRIYIDSVQNKSLGKDDVEIETLVPPEEIEKRLRGEEKNVVEGNQTYRAATRCRIGARDYERAGKSSYACP